jgi:hypothetical protein
VTWLPVTHDNLYYLNLASELSLGSNPDKEKMDFWDEIYSKHFIIWKQSKENHEEAVRRVQPPVVIETSEEPQPLLVVDAPEEPQLKIVEEPAPISVIESNVEEKNVQTHVKVVENETQVQVAENVQKHVKVVENVQTQVKVVENVETYVNVVDNVETHVKVIEHSETETVHVNGNSNGVKNLRTSNEIKMVNHANGAPKEVIRANDPPEDDLPKNIGVNKFVNFFESLGGKK